MDFHVITPSGTYLVMEMEEGRVLQVWATPPDSRPVEYGADALQAA
jgi:hypothetical protein